MCMFLDKELIIYSIFYSINIDTHRIYMYYLSVSLYTYIYVYTCISLKFVVKTLKIHITEIVGRGWLSTMTLPQRVRVCRF
jgi:hypothetical protein